MLEAGEVTPGRILHASQGKDGDSIKQVRQEVSKRPEKDKPVSRPKKQSVAEKTAKTAPTLLELADSMYKAFADIYGDDSELPNEARAYWKARNK